MQYVMYFRFVDDVITGHFAFAVVSTCDRLSGGFIFVRPHLCELFNGGKVCYPRLPCIASSFFSVLNYAIGCEEHLRTFCVELEVNQ